jgi:hypothetical protein
MSLKVILGALLISLWSCTKQVTCEGIVYSRYGFPVSNADVYFNVYGSASSYPTGSSEYRTDKDGRFSFFVKVNKKYPMELEVRSDSGSVRKWLGRPASGTDFNLAITLK